MLLVLGLIEDPEPDEPVPVIFVVASWNPMAERLDAHLGRQLVRDHAELTPADAARLLDHGRVLPVLDGLDELTAGTPAAALRELELFAADGRALVVTCRTREFAAAIAQDGEAALSRAAVIEIQPVRADTAAAFLTDAPQAAGRWQSVADDLRAHPGGSLARVLSTPLMVGLARAAYRDPASTPDELLGLPDETTIARVVMDAFVADAYQSRPPDESRYDPVRADREIALRYLDPLIFLPWQQGIRSLVPSRLFPGSIRWRFGRDARAGFRVVVPAAAAAAAAFATGGFATAMLWSVIAGTITWVNVVDLHAAMFARAWQQRALTTWRRPAVRALFGGSAHGPSPTSLPRPGCCRPR